MGKKFLGLDSSTQSLTAIVIEENGNNAEIIYEKSLNFDSEFPRYQTRNGFLPSDDLEAHSPPQIWVEALDSLLQTMDDEVNWMKDIECVAVSGQQHGSVYLNRESRTILSSLSPEESLVSQLENVYTRPTSPIWMDASTTEECREIAESMGGAENLCKITGSMPFERFTGPQIRKFYKQNKKAYEDTAHICLVSSFLPSILAGKIGPIDPGDGAGMNLMDISSFSWNEEAIKATAPNLMKKLPQVLPSYSLVGSISKYFALKYNMKPKCQIALGTGDNPSSLIGLGLVSSGAVGISLGTSDTLFAYMTKAVTDPTGQSHVFGSPTGQYMSLSCYKNGSLAREKIRNQFKLEWSEFSDILQSSPAGNLGRIMLPYFDTEIIPHVEAPRVVRKGFDENNLEANVRGVVEGQMMSMNLHSKWMPEPPERIYVTGGASSNHQILQIMADVFQVPVHPQQSTNAAGLGAAIRAQHAWYKNMETEKSWETLVEPFLDLEKSNAVYPKPENRDATQQSLMEYEKLEKEFLKRQAEVLG